MTWGRWRERHIRLINSFFLPLYPDTCCSVAWLQARRVHLLSTPPFASLHEQMCCVGLPGTHYACSEYTARFITIKVSPKGIETHQPFCEQPWTLAVLLFVTSSNKSGCSPNTWKGLLLMLPTSCALSGWNKPSQLSSLQNKPKIPWSNLIHRLTCQSINA